MRVVDVALAPRYYKVSIGSGLASRMTELPDVAGLLKARRVALISDENVYGLHGAVIESGLTRAGANLGAVVLMRPGEENKNLATLSGIWDRMVNSSIERADLVVAFGGGVVGDVAGFAAATYLRGIQFMQVPTTILAMVDSSVGGKTGIDHPSGKNLLGAFHQPAAVVADTDFLATLPEREALSGLAEAIKSAILADRTLFDLLEREGPGITAKREALEETVARCVAVKAGIVAQDEREGGPRALLNLGHTLGHAVEAANGFAGVTHGEAVALGMLFAARLSEKLGVIEKKEAGRIVALLSAWNYPSRAGGLSVEEIKKAFAFDKKKASGKVRWVLPTGIGSARWGQTVEEETIDALLVGMQGKR